ncbi:MAG: ferrochelatase [Steroidobacteraceae bacterium]|nr:ferrochelatase [Steroidobacteraceae bacterium]
MRYLSSSKYDHDTPERIGVLLVNSGTPDSTSTADVRRFLGRLLGDPRVVELPRVLWLPLLHGIILRTRPFRSARKYRSIWTDQGSPLLAYSAQLRERLAARLGERVIAPIAVEMGMLYASPSVPEALGRLRDAGAQRILVVPMFPQYCGVTTGAVHDQVTDELSRWRWLPELRFVSEYHEHTGYIEALRASVADHWALNGRTEHLLLSFHGIPDKYFRRGDPYYCKCQKTARLLADELNLPEGSWSLSFQSRYGPGKWLRPYTDEVLEAMPKRGIRSVTVACPGFAVDCLETLEEVDIEYRERFLAAGGTNFQYVPALNAHPSHATALADLVVRHLQGWTPVNVGWLGVPAATR